MKQHKLVIMVLAIAALLFVLGIGTGFFTGRKASDNELTLDSAGKYKKTWVAATQRFLAPFYSLDDQRIQPLSKGQAGKRTYRLTDDKVHDITILRKSGAEIETAAVRVRENYVKMIVRFSEESDSAKSRDPRKRIKLTTRPGINVTGGAIFQPTQNIELSVLYFASGEETVNLSSEQTDEVRLAVLEGGGTLRLQCKGCSKNRPVTVLLE